MGSQAVVTALTSFSFPDFPQAWGFMRRPNPSARQVPDTNARRDTSVEQNKLEDRIWGIRPGERQLSRSVLCFHGLIYRPSMMDMGWVMS